ncbi:TetR/AcrR family transcriptional regulator [Nocardiopsis exhalans]|uniref:TetR/AcrR family transcriptional regulator n=1 Tax=Nocardiopsis exhalans TaxID=163604 RepID=A0ABY5D5D5_9ACTN|nr:TetR/AcrR family transcriptional regulator [Nocardiopsis exhalans]USY18458.1 TetR/AcrR family transcriptional regulator [Nocardiopsis exhalans]
MARKADPARRREVLDAVIEQLAHTGISGFTLRGLAQGLGQSTRVLTHHFADREDLLSAVLARLDELQHRSLLATRGWEDPAVPVSDIVREAWRRNLGDEELPMTRLIREIEGLAAAGRLPATGAGFVRGRAEFVASCLTLRGVPADRALTLATLLNSAFSGLETDYLVTGDRGRGETGLDLLCAWIDSMAPAH